MTSRRELLKWTMAMMAIPAAARAATNSAAAAADPGRAAKPLDILLLGGTGFLGPHQVDYALARGHRVTLFNRGKRAKGLDDDRVEVLIGDRDAKIAPGLEALQGTRRWDISTTTRATCRGTFATPSCCSRIASAVTSMSRRCPFMTRPAVPCSTNPRRSSQPRARMSRRSPRANLRAAQGGVRPHRAGRVRRQGDHRASELIFRPGRYHLQIPLLGRASGAWRRRARPA